MSEEINEESNKLEFSEVNNRHNHTVSKEKGFRIIFLHGVILKITLQNLKKINHHSRKLETSKVSKEK